MSRRNLGAFFNGEFAMNKWVLATVSVIALSLAGPSVALAQTTTPSQGYQGQPSTYGQTNTAQPSTYGQTNTGMPSYQGQPSTSTGQPSTYGQTSTGQPSTYGQTSTGQPSVYGQPSYGQANAGMPGSYGQPSTYRRSTAMGGPEVQQVQQQLQTAGLYRGAVDGQMGPETRRAISQFQRQRGLRSTGVLNQQTLSALSSEPAGAGSSMAAPGTQPSAAGTSGAATPSTTPNMRR